MSQAKTSEIVRIAKAFDYSMQGLKAAYKSEPAFRSELLVGFFLLPMGLWFSETPVEMAVLIITAGLVLLMELINSAIEAIVDRISLEHHELSGKAKDIGSSAVFVALTIMLVTWSVILLPKWFH